MVYIRSKKIKSDQYLYLVKSVWDSKKNTSKQEIVKYLGKASEVIKDDMPVEYRDNPKILSVLASHNPKDFRKREDASKKSRQQLYKKLTEGNSQECINNYKEYTQTFNISDYFDKILKPVMYEVGEKWANNKISIATEHIASNAAQTLVKNIKNNTASQGNKKKILICVPVGEEHHLGCDVLETYLSSKKFTIYNMGTSIPTESILNFIEEKRPDVMMISITLEENITAGQRLVKKIKSQYDIPILIGGYALQAEKIPKMDAEVIKNTDLDEIPKILKKTRGWQ